MSDSTTVLQQSLQPVKFIQDWGHMGQSIRDALEHASQSLDQSVQEVGRKLNQRIDEAGQSLELSVQQSAQSLQDGATHAHDKLSQVEMVGRMRFRMLPMPSVKCAVCRIRFRQRCGSIEMEANWDVRSKC